MEIKIKDPEINTDEIMKLIRENIKKRNYDGEVDWSQISKLYSIDQLSQDSSALNLLLKEQLNLNRTWSYSPEFFISSNKTIINRIKVLVKKAIRKGLRWYFNPVVDKQVQFNATIVRAINQLVELNQQNSDIDTVKSRLDQLEDRMTRLEYSIQSLLSALSDEIRKPERN